MKRSMGWIPEPLNTRHWLTSRLYSTEQAFDTAGDYDLRPYSRGVQNQGYLGSCVAQAVCKAVEIKTLADKGVQVDLSRLCLYYLARELMGPDYVKQDSGAYISSGMDVLRRFGVPLESAWKYDIGRFDVSPSFAVMRKAYNHRVQGFYRIASTGEARIGEIVEQLRLGHPVVFGTAVDAALMDYEEGTLLPPSGPIFGYHAMTIVGWLGGRWVIENSWGDDWGDKGFAYASPEYVLDPNTLDFWVVRMPWE
jgi:C1A family cysteine protease